MAGNDGAASIQACAMRIARLAADGSTPAGATNMMVVNGLIKLESKMVKEAGDEITVKNACGQVLFYYKAQDVIKAITGTITYAAPDPELVELITGSSLITLGGQSVGYSLPAIGQAFYTGVSLELWAKAWVGGSVPAPAVVNDGATTSSSTTVTSSGANFTSADVGRTISGTGIPVAATISTVTNSTTVVISAAATATGTNVQLTLGRPGQFIRHVFPKFLGTIGDFALENGARQLVIDGTFEENYSIGNGPANDFPVNMVGGRIHSAFRDSSIPATSIGYQATPVQV